LSFLDISLAEIMRIWCRCPAVFVGIDDREVKRTFGIRRGSRKVGKRIDWFWEAYWKENGRDVSRRFSENAYGDGIAERKAREARWAAEERFSNLRQSR
jgi:hypothetical protein